MTIVPMETVSSQGLLDRIPTNAVLQENLRLIVELVKCFHQEPERSVKVFEALGRFLDELPSEVEQLLGMPFSVMMQMGNFCNAGGKVIFVDPPDSEEEPCEKERS